MGFPDVVKGDCWQNGKMAQGVCMPSSLPFLAMHRSSFGIYFMKCISKKSWVIVKVTREVIELKTNKYIKIKVDGQKKKNLELQNVQIL